MRCRVLLLGVCAVAAACGGTGLGVVAGPAEPRAPFDPSAVTTTMADDRLTTTTVDADTTLAPTTTPVDSGGEGPEPEVTSSGADPKALLRIDPEPASALRYEEAIEQEITVEFQGERQRFDNTVRVELTSLVEVNRSGVLRTVSTVHSVDSGALGLKLGTFVFLVDSDDRNRLIDLRHDPSAEASTEEDAFEQSFADSWRSSAIVLPVEAVGVGAEWEQAIVSPLPTGELAMTRRVRLAAIEGSVVTMDVTIFGASDFDGNAVFGALPGVEQVVSSRVDVTGTGTVVFDLRQTAPGLDIEMDVTMTGQVVVGGEETEVVARIRQVLRATVTPS